MPMPRLQPISFFSMGRSGSASTLLSSAREGQREEAEHRAEVDRDLQDVEVHERRQRRERSGLLVERRLDAAEEEPCIQQPDPDHKAEQGHEINCGKFADAILPELPEIGEDAN